jgi:hypothetical protein
MNTKLAEYLNYGMEKRAAGALSNWLRGRAVALTTKAKPPPSVLNALAEETAHLNHQNRMRKIFGRLYDTPNLHMQDLALGGVLGGGAGYGAGELLEDPDEKGEHSLSRAALVGAGALGGAVGTNALGNVARRYISNTSPLATYNVKNLPKFDLKSLIEHGVKDKPGEHITASGAMGPRHELFRRYLNIHEPNLEKDYFVRNADGALSLNPRTTGPGTDFYKEYVREPFKDERLHGRFTRDVDAGGQYAPDLDQLKAPPKYENTPGPFFKLFGSHDMRNARAGLTPGGGGEAVHELGDTWNFAIDPHEKQELADYAKGLAGSSPLAWGEFLRQPASAYENLAEPGTVGGRMPQYILRQMTESGLRHHSPVIRQKVKVTYPKPVAMSSAPAEMTRPPSIIETLPNESGEAALNPLDSKLLRKGLGLGAAGLGAAGMYGERKGDKGE